jgi:hypothetical protein
VKREYAPMTSHEGTTYFTLTKPPSLYRIVLLDNSKKVFCDDKKDVYFNSPKIGMIGKIEDLGLQEKITDTLCFQLGIIR